MDGVAHLVCETPPATETRTDPDRNAADLGLGFWPKAETKKMRRRRSNLGPKIRERGGENRGWASPRFVL